jgi:outer membrane receptor protein involved in Fe transport
MGGRFLAGAVAIAAATVTVTSSGAARAQVDIEVPSVVLEVQIGPETTESDEELDLANIVQSAAKGVTTVQEAPAIVTVITGDEIRSRGFLNLEQIVDSVPGWMRLGAIHSQFPFPMTRGTVQSTLFMHNGVSLFDSFSNAPWVGRGQPIENIKRVELITGPGGVLWGANSFLGIFNVITKDAEDVDGVEVSATLGDGPGDREVARGYAMLGVTRLLRDDWRLFLHTSFESYKGPAYHMPNMIFTQPLPQANSQQIWGPLVESDQARSMNFVIDGKLSLGAVNFYFFVPWVERYAALGFPGFVARDHIEEDDSVDPASGALLCPQEPPFYDPADKCTDKGHRARAVHMKHADRYVMADYRARFADGKAGMTLKGYGVQTDRSYPQVGIMAPIPILLEGGLSFGLSPKAYRVGASLDGDIELPQNARLLYGVEGSYDWIPNTVERSRQGKGVEINFVGPYPELYGSLPLPCPREPDPAMAGSSRFIDGCPLTFLFDEASRTVLGAYINPQWKVTKKLILDGGARVQIAPDALGKISFGLTPSFGGALVYNFIPDWHVKLNYTQGFRPPVFNNLLGNEESVQIGGDKDLKVETSQAVQAEVNARLFKGDRRIRELTFRADYSYTQMENFIQIVSGAFENTADRGIHSAELLAKLYLQGGHRLELGYTFLQMVSRDAGAIRAVPENWFNLSGVFNLVADKLQAVTSLRVVGSHEDPNLMVDVRGLSYQADMRTGQIGVFDEQGMSQGAGRTVQPHELVFDRLPPGAELTLGMSYTPTRSWRLSGFVYNAFNERYYQPDVFYSLEPRLEFLPNPYEDLNFRVKAEYAF